MRPVEAKYRTTQNFREGATQGVVANPNPASGWGYYVWLYGNYQPFGHAGMDIGCPVGTPIYAPADGTVIYAGWTEDLPGTGNIRKYLLYWNFGGIVTVIQHKGWKSIIAHQSNNDHVRVGQQVKEGQLIGLSGDTKTRTTKVAPHVHIEALVYDDYRTRPAEGIIYGRVDPRLKFGMGLAAQGIITPTETEEIDVAAEERIMAQLNQMVTWEHERFSILRAQNTALLQMLVALDASFRYIKLEDDGSEEAKTLYEVDKGVARPITLAEWQAKGGLEPRIVEQWVIDGLLAQAGVSEATEEGK